MWDFRHSFTYSGSRHQNGFTPSVASSKEESRYPWDRRFDVSKYRSDPFKSRKGFLPHSGTEPQFLERPARRRHYTVRIMSDSSYYLLILCLRIQVFWNVTLNLRAKCYRPFLETSEKNLPNDTASHSVIHRCENPKPRASLVLSMTLHIA